MARQQGWIALLLALVISALLLCINLPFQLGLDLRGGSQLTLEVQPMNSSERVKPEQLEAVQVVLDEGLRTKDIMSPGKKEISTTDMGDAIISKLK